MRYGKIAQMAVNELKKEYYSATFVALRLPYGLQKDEDDAKLALDFIKPDKTINFDTQPSVDTFCQDYFYNTKEYMSDFNKGNV